MQSTSGILRPLAIVLSFCGGTQLVACGSSAKAGAGATSIDGAANGGDAGPSSVSSGGAGGAPGTACSATAPKVLASASASATDLVTSGSDLYFIDATDDLLSTRIRRVRDDGTGDSTVYASSGAGSAVVSMTVARDAIYFIERTPSGYAALYRVTIDGANKTKLSAKDYPSDVVTIGAADDRFVYVSVPSDTGHDLRAVPVSGGSETLLASLHGLAFRDMQIVGSDMWLLANDGLDGYYKVSLSGGSTPVQVSSEACAFEASVTAAGVFCSSALALMRMPLQGGAYTKVLELNDGPVDVSMPDGDYIYLVPKSTPQDRGTLRKFPVKGGTPTDISCGRGTMTVPAFDVNGVYWLEADAADPTKLNLYAASKR